MIYGEAVVEPSSRYVCQTCGVVQPKWVGKCDACGESPRSRMP